MLMYCIDYTCTYLVIIDNDWKLVRADSVCICFVILHHYTALTVFPFRSLEILLFYVHNVNVNVLY